VRPDPAKPDDGPDAALVAGAFGLGKPYDPAIPAARGELGRIWRLETTGGRHQSAARAAGTASQTWAVKELFEPMTEVEAQADVAFQIAALRAGLPLPEPVRKPDGGVLAEVASQEGRPIIVRVYTWVDFPDPVVAAAPVVAASLLARLHRLEWPANRPPHPWFTEPVGEARWRELLDEVAVARPAWSARFREAVPELIAAEALLPPPGAPLVWCHLDFNPYNVLLDVAGRAVIVDWENSGPCALEQELAMALMDFTTDDAQARAFIDAYEAAGGPARLAGPGSFATAFAVQGHLVDRYATAAIAAEAESERRVRSERWIIEMLDILITLPRVERLLSKLSSSA
jgi:hypothetical protein